MLKFILRLFSRGPAPPPNLSSLPHGAGQEVVREILARDRGFAAAISKGERGIYRVCCYQWFTDDWDSGGDAYWHPREVGSLVDTMPAAQEIVEREISEYEATRVK